MQLGLCRWSGLLRCWRSFSVSLEKCQFLSLLFCLLGELTAWSKTILLALLGSHQPTPPNLNPKAFYALVDCHKPKVTSGSVSELANPDSDSFLVHLYTLHTGGDSTKCLTLWAVEVPLKLKMLQSSFFCLHLPLHLSVIIKCWCPSSLWNVQSSLV